MQAILTLVHEVAIAGDLVAKRGVQRQQRHLFLGRLNAHEMLGNGRGDGIDWLGVCRHNIGAMLALSAQRFYKKVQQFPKAHFELLEHDGEHIVPERLLQNLLHRLKN